jgi:tetratricopeptide (TPR) repeat protein
LTGKSNLAAISIEEQLRQAVQIHQGGDLARAELLYREIVSAYPRYAAAWEHLGNLRESAGELNEAVECYQRVLSIDANHASAFNNLANAHARLGNYQEALLSTIEPWQSIRPLSQRT